MASKKTSVFTKVSTAWKNGARFSKRYALYRFGERVASSVSLKRLSKRYREKKDSYIIGYLENRISTVVKSFEGLDYKGDFSDNAPIWVCWWSGIDTAPKIVRRCVESIIANSDGRKVNLINKNNYSDYIDVPIYILKKLETGQMKTAHFADYLRVCLLEKYGGLWLDATLFCSQTIPKLYFDTPVFTMKSEYSDTVFIAKNQWSTFCLGGFCGNVFYSFLRCAFEAYWQEEDYPVDYLFFDYLIYIAVRRIPAVKRYMDEIELNNTHWNSLSAAFNAALPARELDGVLYGDTVFYKLSWKKGYPLTSFEGTPSVYARFVDGEA